MAQFIQIGLPISLALIMFSMGLSLRAKNFAETLKQPRSFGLFLTAQLLLPPITAYIIIVAFNLPPLATVGLFILACSAGGTTSNLFSYLAKGNVALSITLTVASSLITPFSLPLLSEFALSVFADQSTDVVLPVDLAIKRLFVVTIVPVALGVLINQFAHGFSQKAQPWVRRFSTLLFISVISAMTIHHWPNLVKAAPTAIPASLGLLLTTMLLAHTLSNLFALNKADKVTGTIEIGMQNAGMALLITQGFLKSPEMSIVALTYGLIMLIPISLYTFWAKHEAA